MTLREFVKLLRASWYVIVACVLLAGGAAYVYTSRIPPVYEATTRIFLATGVPVGDNNAPTPTPTATKKAGPTATGSASPTPTPKATKTTPPAYIITSSDLQTYLELISSPVVLDPLRKNCLLYTSRCV